jgi:hypothetical protein
MVMAATKSHVIIVEMVTVTTLGLALQTPQCAWDRQRSLCAERQLEPFSTVCPAHFNGTRRDTIFTSSA